MKLYRTLATALATISVAAVGQSEAFSSTERLQGEAEVRVAAAHFANAMRDPDSAVFKNVRIGKRPKPTASSKIVVCGEVNGRNGFGGFSGFQSFIVSGNDIYVGKVLGSSVYESCITDRIFDSRDYSAELKAAFDAALK